MNNKTSIIKTLKGLASGEIEIAKRNALREELKTHTIDTCYTIDTGEWETGIEPKGKNWVIVEQYHNKKEATIGHKKWVEKIKKNPKTKLEDVMEYGL